MVRAIRDVRPTHVFTHRKDRFHRDHVAAHQITLDSVLMASPAGIDTGQLIHRGVRGIYFCGNWEDEEDFRPCLFVGVSPTDVDRWKESVTKYEFVKGAISGFRYFDYYSALFLVRGVRNGLPAAVAFEIADHTKRRVIEELP